MTKPDDKTNAEQKPPHEHAKADVKVDAPASPDAAPAAHHTHAAHAARADELPPLQTALREASQGLLLPSESDAPFELIALEASPDSAALRAASGAPADAPVSETSVDALLEPLGHERDSFDDDEKAEAARFRKLHTLIKERLKGANVYRVGQADVTVWVVGQDEQGAWMALKSQLVET